MHLSTNRQCKIGRLNENNYFINNITKHNRKKRKEQKSDKGLKVHQNWISPIFITAVKYIIGTTNRNFHNFRC